MSTILRGYTSIENKSVIQSPELNIELKNFKDSSQIIFIIDVAESDFQNFDSQINDTINFLRKNRLHLAELKNN